MMRRYLFPVRFLLALLALLASSFADATNYPAKIQRIDLEGGAALYAINDGPATLRISGYPDFPVDSPCCAAAMSVDLF